MKILGAILVIAAILAAFPAHYFLNVRRTSEGGVIMVKGFWDYIIHGLLNLIVGGVLIGAVIVGLYLFFIAEHAVG